MARIRSNGVRLMLVERADRLARDLMVGDVLLAEFRKLGVAVVAADSGTALTAGDDDPTRVLHGCGSGGRRGGARGASRSARSRAKRTCSL